MTRNEFIHQLENPQLVDSSKLIDLQAVIHEFPYCQSSRILLTKAMHVSDNMNFESELKKTAAYVGNRKQLHSLLFTNHEPILEVAHEPEAIPVVEEKSPVIEPSPIIKSALVLEPKESIDLLEQQILTSAINSSILLEVSNEIPDPDELTVVVPTEQDFNFEEPIEAPFTPSFNEHETHSFSEWLDFYSDSPQETEDDSFGLNTENLQTELAPQSKAEFYSATKMAKLSVQEDDDLVTETLATIYADQGNFEKAIKAFEKLQLKYPEKRVYFASRIKKIQNQLNS